MRLPRRPAVRRRGARAGARASAVAGRRPLGRRGTTPRLARRGLRPASSPLQVAGGRRSGARRGARRSALTTRAAVLALVLCAVALTIAYPLREFLSQRAAISKLAGAQRAQEQRVAGLEARKAELADPAYVEALARQRLHFVRPGETVFVVVAPPGPPNAAAGRGQAAPARRPAPWYGQLWGTVEGAGSPRVAPPAP